MTLTAYTYTIHRHESERKALEPREFRLQTIRHRGERPPGTAERLLAFRIDQVVLPAAAAAVRRGNPDVRRNHFFLLEPPECHVYRAGRCVAPSPRLDLAADRRAVRAVTQPNQREQHEVLELADDRPVIIPWINLSHISKYIKYS